MSEPPTARVTINSGGRERTILSFISKPDGPLIIPLRPADTFRESGAQPKQKVPENEKILHQKYTIHLTKRSKINANGFHHELHINEREPINTYHYTRAIKEYNQFAPVCFRRFNFLRADNYDMDKPAGKVIHLGIIDVNNFTLMTGLFVGPKHRKFVYKKIPSVNFYQWFGHEFSIVIMWTFLSLKAHSTGFFIHTETMPYEYWENGPLHELMLPHVMGFDEEGCLRQFSQNIHMMRQEFIDVILGSPDYISEDQYINIRNHLADSRFFREGHCNTKQYTRHLAWMKWKMKTNS